MINNVHGVAIDGAGNLYLADQGNHRIRKVSTSGIITTVAGTGTSGYSGDGGPATEAMISQPGGIAVDGAGNLYFADGATRIRKVSTSGIITTVAGNGFNGCSVDGTNPTEAMLNPNSVAVDGAGNLYIASYGCSRISKISTSGIITTVAGTGTRGYSGDGGPATEAMIGIVQHLAVDGAGNLYITDYSNARIRKVSTSGIITTVAGTGTSGYSGDGGPATEAMIGYALGVAVDGAGNLYISDQGVYRIRKVSTSGIITTVAGTGTQGYSGDGGPAKEAMIGESEGIAVDGAGNLYISDASNRRIRKLIPTTQQVVSFTLMNADTEQPIRDIAPNEVLDLASLPTRNLNIRANTNPSRVGSVRFVMSGTLSRTQTETGFPYALFGDNAGNYNAWIPAVGSYSLTCTPYTGSGATGTAGAPLTVSFTVVEQTAPTNQPPTVNAGEDKTITLPTNSVTLTGSAHDPDGSISSYGWTQQSGPGTATLTNAGTAALTASGLVAGTYVFRLTVTDNQGATAYDEASVLVNPAPSTTQQVVSFTLMNADTEQPIRDIAPNDVLNLATLPTRNLNIRANTNPGRVGSVKFVMSGKLSRTQTETGFPYALFGDNGGNYNAWTPAVGSYSLTCTPYTGSGATGTAGAPLTVSFTVVEQTAPANQPPTVNAGEDKTITLPTNSVTLTSSANDPDGSISSHGWTQQSGPNTATLVNANGATLTASGLVAGTYVFRLTVTDNQGATAYDEASVIVNPAPSTTQQVVSFTLMNADTEQPIRNLTAGDVLDLNSLPTRNLNIRANTNPSRVGSVKFVMSGKLSRTQTETGFPYALFGDNGGNYNAWTPAVGSYSLTCTPYTGSGATGTAGTPLTVSFTVVDNSMARLAVEEKVEREDMQVQYFPNPFVDSFTIQVGDRGQGKLPVAVFDILGRPVLQLEDVQPEQSISLGKEANPGMYFLQVGTGRKAKHYKLIKVQ
ncbi:PKD domain-containing protein [Telluribacter sp. SYSU D00476]|uniref:PKD domain-containing protein n=1 Tax=Telluribacter sp. SYSU D00476 TaxID=2811430 RepID=UPI001FF65F42|nr:T9SS type A sorting domain-containing protein [Telluribacter sp. SYSU D00476]